jgi:hydroxymethylglutaryl-CoA reductase (NADPH)
MFIPSMLLKRLYTFSSLKNIPGGVQLSVKNRLSDAKLIGITQIKVGDQSFPLDQTTLMLPDGSQLSAVEIKKEHPLDFPLRQTLDIRAPIQLLAAGKYTVEIG